MQLNIKSDEAHQLANELSRLTGETVTQAVTTAVRERLGRVKRQPEVLAERLLAIGRDCAKHLPAPTLSVDHGDLLYDDLGLPR